MSDSLFYQSYGQKSKPALVLLHSGGMAGVEWQPQRQYLEKSFFVLVPDLPGHGHSIAEADKPLSIAMMAKSVIDLLKDNGLIKAHIVGSSMGGAVALWIALNYPQYLDKLVIYRIGYTKSEASYQQTQLMADPAYWQRYGLVNFLSQLHLPQGGEEAWKTVVASVSEILSPQTTDHNHSLCDLKKIVAPTLIIAGDSDPLIPLSELLLMKESIANASLWIIPHASHVTASNTWRARAFAEELSRFLNLTN